MTYEETFVCSCQSIECARRANGLCSFYEHTIEKCSNTNGSFAISEYDLIRNLANEAVARDVSVNEYIDYCWSKSPTIKNHYKTICKANKELVDSTTKKFYEEFYKWCESSK